MARRYRGNKVENKRWEFNSKRRFEEKDKVEKRAKELIDNRYKPKDQRTHLYK